MGRKQPYHRTAALLGAQARPTSRVRRRRRRRQSVRIPWKLVVVVVLAVALVGSFFGWLTMDDDWYVTPNRLHVAGISSAALARDIALVSELLDVHGLLLRESATAELLSERFVGLTATEVTCQRFPAECTIYVEERQPVLIWITEGQMYWIDAEGLVFPAYETRPDLPQIEGPLPDQLTFRRRLAVFQGIQALGAIGVPVDELEYNPERGLVWSDTEGRRVAFGVGEDMQPRWEMYLALVAHLEAKNIFPWTIDVRFPGGPTYSLERAW